MSEMLYSLKYTSLNKSKWIKEDDTKADAFNLYIKSIALTLMNGVFRFNCPDPIV